MARSALAQAKRIVVKVGSSLLAELGGRGVDEAFLYSLVKQVCAERAQGRSIVLVSSGAVAAGCVELALPSRPTSLPRIQAAAAVGQCALMRLYRDAFAQENVVVGQVLLTRDDLHDRARYLHARNTLRELLDLGAVPVVNENDTVAVAELKLKMGDNDALAVAVAQLIDAEAILLLSDVPGLYDRPPEQADAELIGYVEELRKEHWESAGGSVSGVGSGGMSTKLGAARGAAMASVPLVVADGRQAGVIHDVLQGEDVGTCFAPRSRRTSSRGQWIAFGRPTGGGVVVDDGARKALVEGKKSLLAIGVREVRGQFQEADTISVIGLDGVEIARGMVNFNAEELSRIAGRQSEELEEILGYAACETVIHRDNLVVLV